MRLFVNLLFPLVMTVSRIFGEEYTERFLGVLIHWNNRLVKDKIKENRRNLLLLIPTCLQRSVCQAKILDDLQVCKRCGECPINDLIQIKEMYGVDLQIATGGRLAKEIVKRKRPKAVVACACEKELASGIFETYPLPVFGIINQRPKGSCRDTLVNMEIVHQAIGNR